MRPDLPTGTVTFLFTDIEGSTSLLDELGAEHYADALAAHRAAIREACAEHGGVEVDTQGDAFFFAFPAALGALDAASQFTNRLAADGPIRVRVGVHTGTPLRGEEGYVGHDVHRAARIAAAGHGGQVLVSASTASLVESELTDLGEHRFKDLAAPERVFQLGSGEFPGLKSLYRTNLPIPATAFLGRERELREVVELLEREDARLVTLTGSGGTGKTRLMLQAAAEASEGFPDGVHWIPLAPLRDETAVGATFAQALQVRDRAGIEVGPSIVAELGTNRSLIVVDNCEHLVAGVAELVGQLVGGCRNVVVVASSRERLGLRAERIYEVPPMATGDGRVLFVERASAVRPGFQPDEQVDAICDAVDQLPLAIELAAARVRALSTAAIHERLGERLALLTSRERDVEERQRTLEATIAWSYDLLEDDERRVLRALSVFAGGCTLAAAEAVAGADLDSIESLLDKSLVRHRMDEAGQDRYWMLETLREYARERLDGSGETDQYALRHAHWYLERLEENHPDVYGPRHGELMAWFVSEEDNLRAMLTVLSAASPSRAARAARLLHSYWKSHGAYSEGRQRLTELLDHDGMPGRSRAELFGLLSDIEFLVGDLDAAEAAARQTLRLAEPGGEFRAYALVVLAGIAAARGEREEAIRLGREALEEIDEVDDGKRPGFRVDVAGVFRDAGLREEARAVYKQVSDEARRLGDPLLVAYAEGSACWIDLLEQRYEAAEAGFLSVLESERGRGHAVWDADTLRGLGLARLGLGRRAEARAALTSSLEILAAFPTPSVELTATLQWLALASEPGDVRPAARLAGAVAAVRQNARLTGWPGELELRRHFEQPLIDALGEDDWAREQAAAATLTLEEAIELARTLAAPTLETTTHST